MRSRRWDELAPASKVAVMLLASVHLSLAVSTWADLATRPGGQLRDPERTWALVIAVPFVGPVLYFVGNRRGSAPPVGTG